MATDTPVEVFRNEGVVQGQPQATAAGPHDGLHRMSEVITHTDRVILDPNSPEAVQVPENCGASTVGVLGPLGEADARHPEDLIAEGVEKSSSKKS